MEVVLDVYKRSYNNRNPVICMDETPRQLIGETREPTPQKLGVPERYDYVYKRNGVCNIFMASEPLTGKRYPKVTEYKTRKDWAKFMAEVAGLYSESDKITMVMDNLGTHTIGSFYEAYPPEIAKTWIDRFEFAHAHGLVYCLI
ncbi:MAG: transposase [Gammaproteobacteria bacterium]